MNATRNCNLPGERSTLKVQSGKRPYEIPGYVTVILLWLLVSSCSPSARSLPVSTCPPVESSFLVLVKEGSSVQRYGNTGLEKLLLDPASTIKPALALALLKDGFSPDTQILVKDPYIKGTPRKINLSEALLYSSNDYFIELTRKKGTSFFRNSLEALDYFPGKLPAQWPEKMEEIVHGGDMKTTPLHQFMFMERILNEELPKSTELLPLIEWPRTAMDRSSNPDLHLYGKTGAWNKTVWFVGGAKQEDKIRTVVIVTRGHWTLRKEAIATFYCSFDQDMPEHPLIP